MKDKIMDLDDCTIDALNFFIKNGVPRIDLTQFKRPLVIGSGNAAVTGKIIMEDSASIFADESNYSKKLIYFHDIDVCILISASGKKHALLIAKDLKDKGYKVILFTNTKHSPAEKFSDEVHIFKKNIEPYTYNISSYMGMILSKTKENPHSILSSINMIKEKIPKTLAKYDSYFIIIPQRFESMREMFMTKFDELFGPIISVRVFTPEQAKHAKTIISSKKELFVSFGFDNRLFGENRLNIPLPDNANYASLMALGYYFIGQIQKQNKPYFKKNIARYVKEASKIFNNKITVKE